LNDLLVKSNLSPFVIPRLSKDQFILPLFPSFPSCTWERLLIPAKFHFAPVGQYLGGKIGNKIASARAFPSATWERGSGL